MKDHDWGGMVVIGLPVLAENEMTSTKKGWTPIANPFWFLKMVRNSVLNGTPAVKLNELYGLYGLIDLQSTPKRDSEPSHFLDLSYS